MFEDNTHISVLFGDVLDGVIDSQAKVSMLM